MMKNVLKRIRKQRQAKEAGAAAQSQTEASQTGSGGSVSAPTTYELCSVNLWGMKEKEQEEVIDRFIQFPNALTEPTTFRMIEDSRNVRAGSSVYENARYKRYFIETNSEPEAAVSMIGARYERIPSIPEGDTA